MQNPVRTIRSSYQNIAAELRKCTWPTRQELVESTLVVICSVVILSLFVYSLDILFNFVMQWLMR